ncbi:MAG: hypothetical protein CMJ18_27685 [Phycisphaeraceae bacterium]|nr:hypothetical protein [Phycisphaeraceae bacterium]
MTRASRNTIECHRPALLVALVAIAILGIGCSSKPAPHSYSKSHTAPEIDDDFDYAGDRPATPRTLIIMSRILARQGKDDKCAFVLNKLMQEHPRYLPAYVDMAELHMRHRRVDDAIATLNRGLVISPNDPILTNNLGICELLRGRDDAALENFRRSAAARPDDARFQANVAVALGLLGRYEQSLETYRTLMARPGEAHYNLGVLSEARGDYLKAAELYATAAQLDRSLNVERDLNRVRRLAVARSE